MPPSPGRRSQGWPGGGGPPRIPAPIRLIRTDFKERTMHYPHRISRIKRKRAIGFRARMKTRGGRKLMNRKRRVGRSLNVADK